MINAYYSLLSYEDDKWEEYLERICLYDIFKDLFELYPDKSTLKCVIRYIVWAYSVNSDKVIIGMDWLKNKQQIAEQACLPPNKGLYDDVIFLKSEKVISVITKWLSFQESDAFKQLSVLKDLRVEMQESSLSRIVKSSGECDYDQKFKNAKYAVDLKNMIKDLESELIQNNAVLKEAAKEVKIVAKRKETFGVENFSN